MSSFTPMVMFTAGTSEPLRLDMLAHDIFPGYLIGLICTVRPGSSLTYKVQVTGDWGSSDWNDHDTLVALTSSANGNIGYPVAGIQLVVSNWISGSVKVAPVRWP